MSKTEPVILTNMCMVYKGDMVLVQNRVDPKWPGVVFPGGHVEPGESLVRSAIREVREETGLTVSNLQLCGVKHFCRVGEYRYLVFFYKTDSFSGTLRSSDEGEVFWVNRKELRNYSMPEGFPQMLEIFERDDLSENYYWQDDAGEWRCENL